MSKKKRKKKPKRRFLELLTAILHCKAQVFHDRREERGGAKNKQSDYQDENY